MSTFLELVRATSAASGTMPDPSAPTTLNNQKGRMLRFIGWVREAYEIIQTEEPDWLWLDADFEGNTLANVQRYYADALGAGDRFDYWKIPRPDAPEVFTVQDPAKGREDEGRMAFRAWEDFRSSMMIGDNVAERGKPLYYTVDPQQRLAFFPTPDKAYTIRGTFHRGPQSLQLDTDVPEMPASFHRIIKYRALLLMCEFDEAFEQYNLWTRQYVDLRSQLSERQRPDVIFGGPLA